MNILDRLDAEIDRLDAEIGDTKPHRSYRRFCQLIRARDAIADAVEAGENSLKPTGLSDEESRLVAFIVEHTTKTGSTHPAVFRRWTRDNGFSISGRNISKCVEAAGIKIDDEFLYRCQVRS
jgi:hypothetical protein